jgi:hypothetical protein
MSTFLELVDDLHREVGASGVAPAAVTNQVGEANRLVNWVKEADHYVQTLWHNWKFLLANPQYSVSTIPSTATLAKPSLCHAWDLKTFFIDGDPLDAVEYDTIKREVLTTDEGQPSRVIIMSDLSLKFDPIPNDVYLITADFFLEPTDLAANADVSKIPPEYHQVILGRAIRLYANYENAKEIEDQGDQIYSEFITRLQDHQLPSQDNSQYRSTGNFIEVIAE